MSDQQNVGDKILHQDAVEEVIGEVIAKRKITLFKLDDIFTPATGWRFPTAAGPDGYDNEAACYVADSELFVYGDIINLNAFSDNDGSILVGTFAAEFSSVEGPRFELYRPSFDNVFSYQFRVLTGSNGISELYVGVIGTGTVDVEDGIYPRGLRFPLNGAVS